MNLTTCYVVLALAGGIALFRNHRTCAVRIAFIWSTDFPSAYHALPSYDAMVFHPKYWLLWTEAHWRAWLARNREVA